MRPAGEAARRSAGRGRRAQGAQRASHTYSHKAAMHPAAAAALAKRYGQRVEVGQHVRELLRPAEAEREQAVRRGAAARRAWPQPPPLKHRAAAAAARTTPPPRRRAADARRRDRAGGVQVELIVRVRALARSAPLRPLVVATGAACHPCALTLCRAPRAAVRALRLSGRALRASRDAARRRSAERCRHGIQRARRRAADRADGPGRAAPERIGGVPVAERAINKPRRPDARAAHLDGRTARGVQVVRCESEEEGALQQQRVVALALEHAPRARVQPARRDWQQSRSRPGDALAMPRVGRVARVEDDRGWPAKGAAELPEDVLAQRELVRVAPAGGRPVEEVDERGGLKLFARTRSSAWGQSRAVKGSGVGLSASATAHVRVHMGIARARVRTPHLIAAPPFGRRHKHAANRLSRRLAQPGDEAGVLALGGARALSQPKSLRRPLGRHAQRQRREHPQKPRCHRQTDTNRWTSSDSLGPTWLGR